MKLKIGKGDLTGYELRLLKNGLQTVTGTGRRKARRKKKVSRRPGNHGTGWHQTTHKKKSDITGTAVHFKNRMMGSF